MRASTVAFAAVSLALIVGGASFASAQDTGSGEAAKPAAAAEPAKQPWLVNCADADRDGTLDCAMSQSLIARTNGMKLFAVSVRKVSGAPVMRMSLPHGVMLSNGVDVRIDDGGNKKVPIVSADAQGSYADLLIDEGFLGAMRNGAMLKSSFTATNGQKLETQISLKGFSDAFGRL